VRQIFLKKANKLGKQDIRRSFFIEDVESIQFFSSNFDAISFGFYFFGDDNFSQFFLVTSFFGFQSDDGWRRDLT